MATRKELFFSFLRLGATAFGGPAMVAHIRDLALTKRQWVSEKEFKTGLGLCQSIPGATVIQLTAYIGLRAGGIAGALASYVGFGLPAFALMVMLSVLYSRYNALPEIGSLFNGLQVIVIAILVNAIYTFGKSNLKNIWTAVIAVLSALLLWQGVSPFIVVIAAGLAGVVVLPKPRAETSSSQGQRTIPWETRKILALGCLFLAALVGLYAVSGALFDLATTMFKVDLFAFGGGFAILPLMLHEVVTAQGWMTNATFMDGIALGQVTPGPIVITASFVGYMVQGFAGAVIATIAIFTPSFFLVVSLAPVFDKLRSSPYFAKAIDGILASFVGLLLFVLIKFTMAIPWDVTRIIVGLAALAALIRKVDILYVVPVGAVLSVIFL